MTLPRTLRTSAAAMAVAAAFGTVAPAYADDVVQHPLLGVKGTRYMFLLDEQVSAIPGVPMGTGDRVGGFVGALEAKLRAPMDRPQSVTYPPGPMQGQLIMTAVVPPRSKFASANIPVCVEMGDRILGTYSITPDGRVLTDTWAGMAQPTAAPSAPGKFELLCKPYILERGKAMMTGPESADRK